MRGKSGKPIGSKKSVKNVDLQRHSLILVRNAVPPEKHVGRKNRKKSDLIGKNRNKSEKIGKNQKNKSFYTFPHHLLGLKRGIGHCTLYIYVKNRNNESNLRLYIFDFGNSL